MTNIVKIENKEIMVIDSREVAEMLGKEHKEVLNYIEGRKDKNGKDLVVGIIPTLIGADLRSSNYFIESTYKDSLNRTKKCYLITKQGCELLGNKQQGAKGILFSAKYVERFNQMEKELRNKSLDSYMIEDPIKRAKRWIEEQEQAQLLLEQKQQVIDTIVDDKTTFEQFNKQIVTIMNRICTQKSSKLSTVYNEFYYYLNMKMGINVILRVNNRREKLNNEYFKKTGKKYSEKTLKQKVTGLKVIKEEEYNEVLQIAKAWAVKLGVNIVDLNKLN